MSAKHINSKHLASIKLAAELGMLTDAELETLEKVESIKVAGGHIQARLQKYTGENLQNLIELLPPDILVEELLLLRTRAEALRDLGDAYAQRVIDDINARLNSCGRA